MKKFTLLFCVFLLFQTSNNLFASHPQLFGPTDFEVEAPSFFVEGVETTGTLVCLDESKLIEAQNMVSVVINGERKNLQFKGGKAAFKVMFDRPEPMSIKAGGYIYVQDVNPIPIWMSIIPPLLVIGLAVITKEVVSSLMFGILAGVTITGFYSSSESVFLGFFKLIDTYVVDSMTDSGHVSVIIFSTVIGGIVALISKNGGMQGVVNLISKKATNAKRGQLVTWSLGLAIFFDDYANTLVVGNTMRSLTDKLKISREKLSYLVDSTAAPVAAIALITTWIGAELGYIEGALENINSGGEQISMASYHIFLGSLEYAFYPIFCLAFMLILILKNKDFGPMYKAEVKARNSEALHASDLHTATFEEFEPKEGVKPRFWNALIPILVIIGGTVIGLLATGHDPSVWSDDGMSFGTKLSVTIGNSDSYKALLWASLSGLVVAILITILQRIMTLRESVEVSIEGFKTMVNAIIILILAWSLASITDHMHTADFLAGLSAGNVSIWLLPAITFLISALVAFSTGSSWGTMAIVYPLMLPLSWSLGMEQGVEPEIAMALFLNVTSCVLSGSVLGDHCSPISDTTILSSLATQCDHLEHVRTQMPYALTVGLVAVFFTTISTYFSMPWYLTFPLGIGMLFGVVHYFGKEVPLAQA